LLLLRFELITQVLSFVGDGMKNLVFPPLLVRFLSSLTVLGDRIDLLSLVPPFDNTRTTTLALIFVNALVLMTKSQANFSPPFLNNQKL
jgi:hypothetical protein